MSTSMRHAMAASAAVLVAVLVAVIILAGHAEARSKEGHGGKACRNAARCSDKPHKPHKSPSPTPIAPGCVEYGPDCVIDLTTAWPTAIPTVEVTQTFPSPFDLPTDLPTP